jgi:hypothetical protein
VKSAFTITTTPTLITNSSKYRFYSATNSLTILKLGGFTFSLMGKKQQFVNLTGCRTLSKIGDAVSIFKHTLKIEKVSNFKINSISFTSTIGVEDYQFNMLKNVKPRHFTVKKFPRFSAICFKHEDLRMSANYFHKSRIIVCMGGRSTGDIHRYITDLKSIGFI